MDHKRAVFITGGGSGLGSAVARLLAEAGWRVGIAGRNADKLAQALALLPGAASSHELDVTNALAVTAAIESFQPDALVNCAAILGQGEVFDELTPARFAEVMAINVNGSFNACRAAMCLWQRTGRPGDIVNMSSLGGLRGMQAFPGFGAYAASKHAIVGLTEALALDGKAHGIRVNALAPGTLRSAMTEQLGLTPTTLPQDVAPSVAFLLDRAQSGAMSGTTVEIHCND